MFEKGYIPTPEHRRKLSLAKLGKTEELHNGWLGRKATYRAVHSWVVRHYGQSDVCEGCGKTELTGHKIHWACLGDWRNRDRGNWKRMCAKCHAVYDKVNNLRKKRYVH